MSRIDDLVAFVLHLKRIGVIEDRKSSTLDRCDPELDEKRIKTLAHDFWDMQHGED